MLCLCVLFPRMQLDSFGIRLTNTHSRMDQSVRCGFDSSCDVTYYCRFTNTTQAEADAALPTIEPLPTVAQRQPFCSAPLEIPDSLKPAPTNLPAPVTYNGYSSTEWKALMKATGCDQLSMYQPKKRATKGGKKVQQEASIGQVLEQMQGRQLQGSAQEEWDCTVVGAIRTKSGVQVALLWEADDGTIEGTWEPIENLVNTIPGTENHTFSFGQGREGETIVVQWASERRYVAELQCWNYDEDSFTLVYNEQETSVELKTSKTEAQSHEFRLDTLETDLLATPGVGASGGL